MNVNLRCRAMFSKLQCEFALATWTTAQIKMLIFVFDMCLASMSRSHSLAFSWKPTKYTRTHTYSGCGFAATSPRCAPNFSVLYRFYYGVKSKMKTNPSDNNDKAAQHRDIHYTYIKKLIRRGRDVKKTCGERSSSEIFIIISKFICFCQIILCRHNCSSLAL